MLEGYEESQKVEREYMEKLEIDAIRNPTSDVIQIVVAEPMKTPYKKSIANELEAYQEIVDGYIEIINVGKTKTGAYLALTLNEEGKLMNLPFNKRLYNKKGSEMIVGTFFITAYNMQGENVTLTDDECEKLIKRFKGMEVYL